MVENTLKQAFDAETLLTGLSFVIKQKRKENNLLKKIFPVMLVWLEDISATWNAVLETSA